MAQTKTTKRRPWKRSHRILLVTVITSVVLVLFIGGAIWTQGSVSGTEFSPTHFQTRRFSFLEVPLLHMQLTPIKRSATTPAASSYLRANGLINVPKGAPRQWHLVRIARGITPGVPGDAEILVHYLQMTTDQQTYWQQWSIDHPEQAAVLWPRIQRLAQRELYVLMPDLFTLARRASASSTAPEVLADQLDRVIRQSTQRLAADLQEAGRVEFARSLLSEALLENPDAPELRAAYEALPPPNDDLPGQ